MANPTIGRLTNVRVSIQLKTEAKDSTWKTRTISYVHSAYQRLRVLVPLTIDERLAMDRLNREADWKAWARVNPRILDGSRLIVQNSNGATILTLDVVRSMPYGREQQLFLREVAAVQS